MSRTTITTRLMILSNRPMCSLVPFPRIPVSCHIRASPPLPIGSSMARCPLYRVPMLLLFTVERISVNNNARTRDQIVDRPRKEQLPRGYCQTNDIIIHKGVQEPLRG